VGWNVAPGALAQKTSGGAGLVTFDRGPMAEDSKAWLLYFPLAPGVARLAWAVGESIARERWSDRLASFESVLRRDPVNATVGQSVMRGLLTAPAYAAAGLGVAAIPILLHIAVDARFALLPSPKGDRTRDDIARPGAVPA